MPPASAETEVRELADCWAAAEVDGDVGTLAGVLAEDFVAVGPLGFLLTRQQWLGRHASGDLVNEEISLHDVQVRVYGDTAVAIAEQRQRTAWQGNAVADSLRVTHVYVRDERGWVLASVHMSTIREPPKPT